MLFNLYSEEKKRKKKKDPPDTQLCSHFLALLYYCTREIKYHHWESSECCDAANSLLGASPPTEPRFTRRTSTSLNVILEMMGWQSPSLERLAAISSDSVSADTQNSFLQRCHFIKTSMYKWSLVMSNMVRAQEKDYCCDRQSVCLNCMVWH